MEEDFDLPEAIIPLVRILVPFIQLSGIILNLFSLYIIHKGQKGPNLPSVHYYLTAALLWQTSALAGLFLQFVPATIPETLPTLRAILYQGLVYSYTVSNASRLWTMVAMTVDRFLALCHPLKHTVISTTSRAKRILAGIPLAAAIFRIPDLIVTICLNNPDRDNQTRCDYYLDGHRGQKKVIDTTWTAVYGVLDSIFIYLAPRIIVVFLSIKMVRLLMKRFRERREFLIVDSHQSQAKELEFDSLLLIIKSGIGSLLLVGISFSFLLLAVYSPRHSTILLGIPLFAEITNMSSNFFIFLMFGRTFRESCKEIIIIGWMRTVAMMPPWSSLEEETTTDGPTQSGNPMEKTLSTILRKEETQKFLAE